jgi:hypothetical protein
MDRADELKSYCKNLDEATQAITEPLIYEIAFLEKRLHDLRGLPFIDVHPTDSRKQRPTVAAKQYKELLQQYNNCLKILLGVLGKIEATEDSPLRAYLKTLKGKDE